MPTIHIGSKGDSKPVPLDSESGILPLSYRAKKVAKSTSTY